MGVTAVRGRDLNGRVEVVMFGVFPKSFFWYSNVGYVLINSFNFVSYEGRKRKQTR